jgi:hypothetical protein
MSEEQSPAPIQSAAAVLTEAPVNVVSHNVQTGELPTSPVKTDNSAPSWLSGADDVTVGYVKNKGWEDPKQVLEGYRNLEKLLGADKANNAIVIPKPDADTKEWDAVYNRLGRPEKPEGYKINVPENTDTAFAKESAIKFHELGLTQKQGEQLAAWYNDRINQSSVQLQQQISQRFQAENEAIRSEWGMAYDKNLSAAQTAVRGLGLNAETIENISNSIGHKATMELFYKIGSKLSEDNFVTGDKSQSFSSVMTPGQAKAEIQSKINDQNFITRYRNGDAEARQEMERLHLYAYPSENQ